MLAPLVAVAGGIALWGVGPGLLLAGAAVLGVLGIAFFTADSRAEHDFWTSFAAGLGLSHIGRHEPLALTPLLGAGDRRHFDHWMIGPMPGGPPGVPVGVGQYTYEIRQENGDKPDTWRHEQFTAAVLDLPDALVLYPGVFVRQKLALRRVFGHEWLRMGRTDKVELESVVFAERYELRVSTDQDAIRLRELFNPAFLAWLSEHPLGPQFEYSAGTLTVFLDGHHEDAGTLTYLLDCARQIAERFLAEVAEERAAGRPVITG